jgi:excisionase family DNA binding protein
MAAHEGMIVMTSAELNELIRRAIGDAVGLTASPRVFLTPEQLAQRLGVCTKSVKTMVSRDGLPAHTVGPRMQRFLWSEVEEWLMARGKNVDTARPASHRRTHLRRVRSPE